MDNKRKILFMLILLSFICLAFFDGIIVLIGWAIAFGTFYLAARWLT